MIAAGEADFSGGALRYRIDAEARAVDLARLPVGAGRACRAGARARGHAALGGLRDRRRGRGQRPPGRAVLDRVLARRGGRRRSRGVARARQGRGHAPSAGRRARSRSPAPGPGARRTGFSGRVEGTVGDLARLLPPGKLALGGSGRFEGEFAVDAQGPRFAGVVRLAKAAVGALRGIEGSARLAAAAGGVRLTEGVVAWPGGRGSVSGTVEIPSGAARPRGGAPAALAPGGGAPARGRPAARRGGARGAAAGARDDRRPRGRRRGRRQGAALPHRRRGRGLALGHLCGPAARRQPAAAAARVDRADVPRGARRGRGRSRGSSRARPSISPTSRRSPGWSSPARCAARVRGRLDDPQVEGVVRAARLRYAGFDFKGGELSVDYRRRDGRRRRLGRGPGEPAARGRRAGQGLALRVGPRAAAVRPGDGPLGARRVPAGAGPGARGGRVPGRRAAPGQRAAARSRLGAGRPAAGHAVAAGRRDVAAEPRARADLLARRGLVVEDFRLASEQYHLAVRGGGSIAGGWNLQAEGAVNLSVFKEYWREIEDVDGRGDLALTLGGPWSAPLPEGSLTVHEAFVRVALAPRAARAPRGAPGAARPHADRHRALGDHERRGVPRRRQLPVRAGSPRGARRGASRPVAVSRAHPGGARVARAGRGAAAHGRDARGARVLGGRRGSRRGDVPAAVSREDHAPAGHGPRGGRAPGGPGAGRANRGRHRAPERDDGLEPLAGPGGRRARRQGHPGLARRRPQGPERPAPRPARGFSGPEARGRGAHSQGALPARVQREAAPARPVRRPGGGFRPARAPTCRGWRST